MIIDTSKYQDLSELLAYVSGECIEQGVSMDSLEQALEDSLECYLAQVNGKSTTSDAIVYFKSNYGVYLEMIRRLLEQEDDDGGYFELMIGWDTPVPPDLTGAQLIDYLHAFWEQTDDYKTQKSLGLV